jgi:hypothetical protein
MPPGLSSSGTSNRSLKSVLALSGRKTLVVVVVVAAVAVLVEGSGGS